MLIKTLKAENFKKYQLLNISDLPEKSIIGIFGANESGKSSISDAVAFSLFGQTAKFSPDTISQLINWDSEECEVELNFKTAEQEEYRVVRHFNRAGASKAALYSLQRPSQAIETGVEAVNQKIEKLTGFNFRNFRYTFYLAQKEIDIITEDLKSNRQDMLQKMLGFDRLHQALDVIGEEEKKLLDKQEKCENELLVTKSRLQDYKVDKTAVRNLQRQIEDNKLSEDRLQKVISEEEKKWDKAKDILGTQEKLENDFKSLEKSLFFNYHKEIFNRSTQSLVNLYRRLQQEQKVLGKKLQSVLTQKESVRKEEVRSKNLAEQLQELSVMIQTHRNHIQRRLILPTEEAKKKTPPGDNLPMALQQEEKKINGVGHTGTGLISISLAFVILAIYAFFSAILSSMGKSVSLFFWAPSGSWLWGIAICSVLIAVASTLALANLQRTLKQARRAKNDILDKMKELTEQAEVCEKVNVMDLGNLSEPISLIEDQQIKQKYQSIADSYVKIFNEYKNILELETELKQKSKDTLSGEKEVEERAKQVQKICQLIDSMIKDDSLNLPATTEKESKPLDLDETEKQVYRLLEMIQEHKTAAKEFEFGEENITLDMDAAWKEYEQQRTKFRELSGLTSIGGGTGMLKRIQMAFRQESTDKFMVTLNQEKENFISGLPKKEEQQISIKSLQKSLDKVSKEKEELGREKKGLKDKHKTDSGEFEKKQEFLTKATALKTQIQNIKRSFEVYETSAEFIRGTIKSSNERFAPSLARVMSRVLPQITDGRYQHVKVEKNLEIKAFSAEKNDFVDISELSGGTVDQLFLSLRLAFAQAMMAAAVGRSSSQFLFFDEPIMSFDEKRSDSFFNLLTDYNNHFVQIFLISPRSYTNVNFDLIIETSLENKTLEIVCEPVSESLSETKKFSRRNLARSKTASKINKEKRAKKEDDLDSQGDKGEQEPPEEEPEDDITIEYDE